MDVVDGRVVSATTAPFLVVNLRVDLRRNLEGITRSVADYYLDDISRDELLEALVAYIKSSAEDQLRKISTMSFESRELGWDGIAPAALNDQDLAQLIAVELSQVNEYHWKKGRPKAYEAGIDYNTPEGYGPATRGATKEFSRLRINPEQLERLQKHDRIHFVVSSWHTPDLLSERYQQVGLGGAS